MHGSRNDQDSKYGGGRHLDVLRGEQDTPSFHAVGDYAADKRKQKNRDATQKLVQRKQKRRMTEPIHKPALRDNLHPRSDARSTRANPHEAEVTVLKCFENTPEQSTFVVAWG
jgi:hypothetical protein